MKSENTGFGWAFVVRSVRVLAVAATTMAIAIDATEAPTVGIEQHPRSTSPSLGQLLADFEAADGLKTVIDTAVLSEVETNALDDTSALDALLTTPTDLDPIQPATVGMEPRPRSASPNLDQLMADVEATEGLETPRGFDLSEIKERERKKQRTD